MKILYKNFGRGLEFVQILKTPDGYIINTAFDGNVDELKTVTFTPEEFLGCCQFPKDSV